MKKRLFLFSLTTLFIYTLIQAIMASQPVLANSSYPNLGEETPITIPSCVENSSTIVIDSDEELQLTIDDPNLRVFCLRPGDYATTKLEIAGTEETPKYLIPYHAPGANVPNPWDIPASNRVTFDQIVFKSAYWYVVGVEVQGDVPLIVEFKQDSTGNVLDRAFVHGISDRVNDGLSSRSMVRMRETSFYNTIQNSVLRNPPRVAREDSHCLAIRDSQYNTVINNQLYNCPGDGIQINEVEGATTSWDNRGNKIINNEIYVTEELYASCSNPSVDANMTSTGECSCAENGIDVKYTASEPLTTEQDKLEFYNNVLYGFRETHMACGGTGDDTAPAIYLHNADTDNILIDSNLIFNSDTGILLKDTGDGGPDNIEVFNNFFFNIRKKNALHIAAGENNQFTHNTIVLTAPEDIPGRRSITILSNAINATVSNNLVISSNTPYRGDFEPVNGDSGTYTIAHNRYVGLATGIENIEGYDERAYPNEPLGNFTSHCVTLGKHIGSNETCFAYLIPTSLSSVINTIATANEGLNYDFFSNTRFLPYDPGAFEVQTTLEYFIYLPVSVNN